MTKRVVFIGAGVLLLATLQIALFHGLRHDDAYITFRYGQNLATGQGLCFNPGERVMGSTSPGHTLLSAAGYALVGKESLPSLMSALGCLAWMAQAIAVALMLRRALSPVALWFTALGIALGAALSYRVVTLETNLVMAFALWGILAGLRSRWLAAAALLALAALFRPDAYLVALPMAVLAVRELRFRVWQPVLLGLAVSLPWYVFAWSYYGSLLPQSMAAKLQSAELSQYALVLFYYPTANLVLPESVIHLPRLMSVPYSQTLVLVVAGLVWAVVTAGAVLLVRRDRRLWVLPACIALYTGAYAALRASVGIEWHLYPIVLLVAVCFLSFVGTSLLHLARGRTGFVVAVGALACVLGYFGFRTARAATLYDRAYWSGARDGVYRSISSYLFDNASPGDVVYADEVGTIAYLSELPMIDPARLVTRDPGESLRQKPPRWFVGIPAYGTPRPPEPVLEAVSKPVLPGEPFARGQRRFAAFLDDYAAYQAFLQARRRSGPGGR